jgi:hypothetical protein
MKMMLFQLNIEASGRFFVVVGTLNVGGIKLFYKSSNSVSEDDTCIISFVSLFVPRYSLFRVFNVRSSSNK